LGKANKLTNTSRSFSLLSELWMRYTPLTWYEQEDLKHKAHLESLPRALFLRLLASKFGSQIQPVGPTGRYTSS